jgi:hypothetical protein
MFEVSDNITSDLSETIITAGFGGDANLTDVESSSLDYMGVIDLTLQCAAASWAASCHDQDINGCRMPHQSAQEYLDESVNGLDPELFITSYPFNSAFANLCNTSSSELNLNADIAGPGVSLSSIIGLSPGILLSGFSKAEHTVIFRS